jgi:Tetracyclin repressor-like, C-terminal domain
MFGNDPMDTRARIISAFCDSLREHGRPPETVFAFCKQLEITEREFFQEFASFDAVESSYWEQLVDQVVCAVEAGPEWPEFTAKQRLLSFLYAFCEASLDHRSVMLARISELGPLAKPAFLKGFEARFKAFTNSILQHGAALGEVAPRGRLSALYPDAFYTHFRGVIDFSLKDDSRGYERTDAFIEKSVAVAFDLIRTQVVDSALDLARFLAPWREGS